MKPFRQETLELLADLIAGNKAVPARDGFAIVQLFQNAGLDCSFYDGTDTKHFALKAVRRYQNDPEGLERIVLRLANPKEYKTQVKMLVVVASRLNQILLTEGLRIGFDGINPKLVPLAPPQPARPAQAGPQLDFVRLTGDAVLSGLLEGRMRELGICMANQAHLAAVILMGTILEGVLLSLVHHHPKEANSSAMVPKDGDDKPRHFADWSLAELVDVARDCKWIQLKETFYIYLVKEYRRLIHPWEQRARNQTTDAKACRECHHEFLALLEDIQKHV